MTISQTLTSQQLPCNGVATQFNFNNKIFAPTDLVVTLIDLLGNLYSFSNGGSGNVFSNVATGLSYTVFNIDVDAGCYIVFSGAPTNGWTCDMRTDTPELQSTSIKNQGAFLPELHEEFFDKIVRIVQDDFRQTYTFAIHGPDIESVPWPTLPIASARKGQALIFDPVTGLPTLGAPSSAVLTAQQLGIFGTDSGVVNAYVYTHVGPIGVTLTTGSAIRFVPLNTNTGPVTINADATGPVAVVRANGAVLTGGEFSSLGPVVLQYNGAAWQIVSTAGAQPGFEKTAAEAAAGIYSISAITQAANAVVTINAANKLNPLSVGQTISISGVVGMTQINGLSGTISAIGGVSGAWTVTLPINSSAFSAYVSGGATLLVLSFNYNYAGPDLRRYTADITGIADSTTAINNAIAAAIAPGGTGQVCHPGGTILHNSTIPVPNGVTIYGYSRDSCVFSYPGTADGWQNVNGPNSSGYAKVQFRGVKLAATNAANVGAGIEFNAGGFAYYQVIDCWIFGKWKRSLILDAVELCVVERSLLDNSSASSDANIWIVNGGDRVAAQTPGFSNVIVIRDNQISSSGVGIGVLDDGGNNHEVAGNNFNNQSLPARFAGCNSLVLHANSFETHAATNANDVLFSNVSNAGNVVGSCTNISLQGCTFAGDMTAAGSQLAFQGQTYNISAISQTNPCVVTINTVSATNPFASISSSSDSPITINGVTGMTQINGVSAIVTATGGVSGAWTLTLGTLNSTTFSAYVSGGTVANYHTGAVVQSNCFTAVAGRGNAIDVTLLGNSFCGYNVDLTVSSGAGHYTGIHNDNLGNTLLAPQNGAFGAGQPTQQTYGDARFRLAYVAGMQYKRVVVPYSASMTFDLGTGNSFDITATNGTAFTINSPNNAADGNQFTVVIRNTSGGALGAITFGASFKLAGAFVAPATGNQRSVRFEVDGGGIAHEVFRTAADVPN